MEEAERVLIASLVVLTGKITGDDAVIKFEPLVRAITTKIELTDEEYWFFTEFFIDVEKAKQRLAEYERWKEYCQRSWQIGDLITFQDSPQEDDGLPF